MVDRTTLILFSVVVKVRTFINNMRAQQLHELLVLSLQQRIELITLRILILEVGDLSFAFSQKSTFFINLLLLHLVSSNFLLLVSRSVLALLLEKVLLSLQLISEFP